jgi:hypothetical protein
VPAESFEKQLARMSLDYLLCRKMGHIPVPFTLETDRSTFDLGVQCARQCGWEAYKVRDWTGKVRTVGTYDPEKHYLFKGTGRLTPDQRQQIWDSLIGELEVLGFPKPDKTHWR